MEMTPFFAIWISVNVIGIIGNTLAIISIARQRQLLKNNYYFLVLHLAVCDLGALITQLLTGIVDVVRYIRFGITCVLHSLHFPFYFSGIIMMLIIAVLRYRATVHPLKPAICRAKLTKVCCVVYVVDSIIGLGLVLPQCFYVNLSDLSGKFLEGIDLLIYLVPTIFMIACYCKIGLALVEQNKQIKRMSSAAVRNRHKHGQRIFRTCLCTVICFAVGRLLNTVSLIWRVAGKYSLVEKNLWIPITSELLIVAGTHSANPLIYGILDKRMFRPIKLCKKKRQTPEELSMQET